MKVYDSEEWAAAHFGLGPAQGLFGWEEIIYVKPSWTDEGFTGEAYNIYVTPRKKKLLPNETDDEAVPQIKWEFDNLINPPGAFKERYRTSEWGSIECPWRLQMPRASPPMHTHITVIISSRSGTGKAPRFFTKVLAKFLNALDLGPEHYRVLTTESEQTIAEYARETIASFAARGARQTVLLLSGDGGVADIINGVAEKKPWNSADYRAPNIALFPLGTGNALFHSLHPPVQRSIKPTPLHVALKVLTSQEEPVELPIFSVEFSPGAKLMKNEGRDAVDLPEGNILYGAVVASYGFHSTLVAESDTAEYRKHGDKRFGMVAATLLGDPHQYRADLTLFKNPKDVVSTPPDSPLGSMQEADEDGNVIDVVPAKEHDYILATMVSRLEKKFVISPASKPHDGKLRLIHLSKRTSGELQEIMGAAYNDGQHIGMSGVSYDDIEGLKVDFLEDGEEKDANGLPGRWTRVCVDGLTIKVEPGGWFRVRRQKHSFVNIVM
jgi:diacylglycerol kinase family enzyme